MRAALEASLGDELQNFFRRAAGDFGMSETAFVFLVVVVLGTLVALLLALQRWGYRRALRQERVGRYEAEDPYGRHHLGRSSTGAATPTTIVSSGNRLTRSPAQNATNHRYRPDLTSAGHWGRASDARLDSAGSSVVPGDPLGARPDMPSPVFVPQVLGEGVAPLNVPTMAGAPASAPLPPPPGARPGWYHDPGGVPGRLRYFNGRDWTDQADRTEEAGNPTSASPTP